jgi:hypothetical protein
MRPARPIYPLIVLLSLAAILSGCSSAPTPQAWAASVCTALAPWRAEISTLATRTQAQMTAATTPGQAKENLMRLFGGAQDASEKARAGVQKAGVPDVAHGAAVAQSFTTSLGAVRDAYGRARSGVQALAIAPAKTFYAQVTTVVDRLNSDYAKSELDTSKLDSKELKDAFDEVPECR